MDEILYCATDKLEEAQQLIAELIASGLDRKDMTLLVPHPTEQRQDLPHDDDEKTSLKAGNGSLINGVIGGALGLYVGVASLVLPGIGLLLVASPLAIVLGTTVAGAAAGAVIGGTAAVLMKAGMPESEAKRHEELVRKGKTLLIVHAKNLADYATATDVIMHSGFSDLTLSAQHARTAAP